MLREMLDQEEKTREILERVQKHQLPSSSSVALPASLPPKVHIIPLYMLLHIPLYIRVEEQVKFLSLDRVKKQQN